MSLTELVYDIQNITSKYLTSDNMLFWISKQYNYHDLKKKGCVPTIHQCEQYTPKDGRYTREKINNNTSNQLYILV